MCFILGIVTLSLGAVTLGQEISIETPAGVVQCGSVRIIWAGGDVPYNVVRPFHRIGRLAHKSPLSTTYRSMLRSSFPSGCGDPILRRKPDQRPVPNPNTPDRHGRFCELDLASGHVCGRSVSLNFADWSRTATRTRPSRTQWSSAHPRTPAALPVPLQPRAPLHRSRSRGRKNQTPAPSQGA
ncbi:hypothetical protein K438DRAFT_126517 [Mycena galopus ATCC 62051]|nr:hypothetical protein K438DRAFT_126517 [Mycena galopus ATCC 62051]